MIDQFVEGQMDKHRVPGIALVTIEDGEVGYAAGYGTAGRGRAVNADTPMSIGSVTKSLTAVGVLQLVERGLLGLDEPVQRYLPWFRVADEGASTNITLRHLLSHTSGMSELGYNRVLSPDTSLGEGVHDLQKARPTAPVGARYQYFNPNYQVLALIIETVSGQTYGDYVAEHIFQPLQMTRSYTDRTQAVKAGMAQGHSKIFGFPLAREHPLREYMLGAGYVISTARDLGHFLIAMDNEGTFEGERILSPEGIALMKSPLEGVEDAPPGTGLAWGVTQEDGETWEHSSGADETSNSQLLWHSESGRGVVWLMNQQHLLDPVRGQLNDGLGEVLLEREPEGNGLSMKTLGLIILAALLVAVILAIRSLLGLRSWPTRARDMSTAALIRSIALHFLVPLVVLIMVYRLLGPALFGEPRAFNFRYVGYYLMPDIALLILAATVPDLIQGLYKTAAIITSWATRASSPSDPSNRQSRPTPVQCPQATSHLKRATPRPKREAYGKRRTPFSD